MANHSWKRGRERIAKSIVAQKRESHSSVSYLQSDDIFRTEKRGDGTLSNCSEPPSHMLRLTGERRERTEREG
jgi:hypothetical protein